MFRDVPAYRNNWKTAWTRSAELLSRSISVPIFVKSTEDEMCAQGEAMLGMLKVL